MPFLYGHRVSQCMRLDGTHQSARFGRGAAPIATIQWRGRPTVVAVRFLYLHLEVATDEKLASHDEGLVWGL